MKHLRIVLQLIIGGLLLLGCSNTTKRGSSPETPIHDYIEIDGEMIELVLDEYGDIYTKQHIGSDVIYIPFTFNDWDEEQGNKSIHIKNQNNGSNTISRIRKRKICTRCIY